jgi:hypothetical protein
MAQEDGNLGELPDAAQAVLNTFKKLGPDDSVASASSLFHTRMTDWETGKFAYTDAQGEVVPQEQVMAHRMAYDALRLIPEVDAEQLIAEWSEDDEKDTPPDGTDIPDDDKPHLDTEMTNTPTPAGEGDDTNPLPAETRGQPNDGSADLDETLNNPEDPLGGLDGSSDSPAPNKPVIPTNSAKSKPIVLIDPAQNKPIDLTGENNDTPEGTDENPQDVDSTPKNVKNTVQDAINSFRNVVKTPSKDAKKSSKSSKKKKKSGKNAQKVASTPETLKRKRVEEDEESDKEESDADEDIGQVSNKQPITTNPRHTPTGGPRHKRWCETKPWRKLLQAEEKGECPTDIDDLVEEAKKEVGRDLQKSYLEKIMKLKVIGFHDKSAQLAAEQETNQTLEGQLNDTFKKLTQAKKKIKDLQAENKRLKDGASNSMVDTPKPKAESPKKKKGKKSSTSKPGSTNTLDLPAPTRNRPTMIVPLSAITYASIPDNIINAGIDMIRSTDGEDWPERAENWVKLAESRPRFNYK